jgi:hypothetical protein
MIKCSEVKHYVSHTVGGEESNLTTQHFPSIHEQSS